MDGGNKWSTAPRVHRLAKARLDPQAYILKVIWGVFRVFNELYGFL